MELTKPQDSRRITNLLQLRASVIVPTTLESNVLKLHQFLYGNTNYTPTEDVLNKSAQITTVAGGGEAQSTSPAATEAPGTTTDDSYTWQGDTDTSYSYDYSSDDSDYSDNTDYSGGDNTDYSGGGDDTDYSGGGDDAGSDYSAEDSGGDSGGGEDLSDGE